MHTNTHDVHVLLYTLQAAIYDLNGMLLDAFQRGSASQLESGAHDDTSNSSSKGLGQPPSAEALLAMVGPHILC
jgi:hypothetical protein